MHRLEKIPGRIAQIEGQSYLYFSGTAYLGMGHLPEFQDFVKTGMEKYGLNFGGSRLSNARFDIFEQAEDFIRHLGQAEAALTVSSGTLAGQLVAKHFEKEATLLYAPESHPALRNAMGISYPTREDWENAVVRLSHQSGPPIVAFSDAVDALHVRFFNYEWLQKLGRERAIILVIDDSHTWGVTGNNGGASYSSIRLPGQVELITLGSLGKAFGIPAGFILGNSQRIRALWQTPFFGGASPTLPAFLYAMVQSKQLYQEQRSRLLANVEDFKSRLTLPQHFRFHSNYPVFHTPFNHLAVFLSQRDLMISSFPYPSPNSDLITRIVINALHTSDDISKLATLVQDFFIKNQL